MDSLAQSAQSRKGFTLVELLITTLIVVTITTLTFVSVTSLRNNTNTQVSTDKLTSDLKSQQVLAMLGKNNGAGPTTTLKPYGVRFELNTPNYILFECDVVIDCQYNPSNPSNQTFNLEGTVVFSQVTMPALSNSSVIFQPASGEIQNYDVNARTVIITNTISNQSRTLRFNRVGTFTVL